MKKQGFIHFAVMLVIIMLFSGLAFADSAFPSENENVFAAPKSSANGCLYEYDSKKKTATVTDFDGSVADLYIPRTVRDASDIEYTVTGIDEYILDYDTLISITFPDSVVGLTSDVFSGATSLETVCVDGGGGDYRVVDGVLFDKDILLLYPSAREGTVYRLPQEGVSGILSYSFDHVKYLKEIVIGSNITQVDYAFNECAALEAINVDAGNQYYKSVDGVLFDKDGSRLILYPASKGGGTYVVPDGTIDIGANFDEVTALKNIRIPQSVAYGYSYQFGDGMTIEGYAGSYAEILAKDCTFVSLGQAENNGLIFELDIDKKTAELVKYYKDDEYVVVPNKTYDCRSNAYNVTNVYWSAFSSDDYRELKVKQLTLPGALNTIDSVFGNMPNLEAVIISGESNRYTAFDGVLYDDGNLCYYPAAKNGASFTVLESIADMRLLEYSFGYARFLETLNIGSNVKEIDTFAFYGCSSIKAINVAQGNENYKSIDGVLFGKNGKSLLRYPSAKDGSQYTVPEGVTSLEAYSFDDAENLRDITIPGGVLTISKSAFNGVAKTSLVIRAPLNSVAHMFAVNMGYEFVPMGEADVDILSLNKPVDIVLKQACTYRFDCSEEGDYIFIVKSDSYRYTYAYLNDGSQNEIGDWYSDYGSVVMRQSLKKGTYFLRGEVTEGYDDPNDKFIVAVYREFVRSDGLRYVIRSSGAAITGYDGSAETLDIPAKIYDDPVTAIWDNAFYNKNCLTDVSISYGVTSIGIGAFIYNRNLKSISLPDSVAVIERYAFSYCSALTHMNIPAGIKVIDRKVFSGCSNLESITIPNGVTAIGSHAFSSCKSLLKINIPASVKSIESHAFDYCESISDFTIEEGLERIGKYALCDCYALEQITIPRGVTSIGEGAFYYCTQLKVANIPDSVTAIGKGAFNDCSQSLVLFGNYGCYAQSWAGENSIEFRGYGDFDGDGHFSADEVETIINHVAGLRIISDIAEFNCADFNRDGKVNNRDAVLVYRQVN